MKTTEKIRLMLVDDHFVVRAGLAGALSVRSSIKVVAECESGEEAIESYRKHRPDVTLMDWRLPEMSGVEATSAIRDEFPDARIIAFTVYEGDEDVFRAAQAGVVGYLPKTVQRNVLLDAIHAAHRGETCFPAAIAVKLANHSSRPTLKERELAVLNRIVKGQSNKEIACRLNVAEATIKFHVGKILEKLGVADRTQAAIVAVERGIIHLE